MLYTRIQKVAGISKAISDVELFPERAHLYLGRCEGCHGDGDANDPSSGSHGGSHARHAPDDRCQFHTKMQVWADAQHFAHSFGGEYDHRWRTGPDASEMSLSTERGAMQAMQAQCVPPHVRMRRKAKSGYLAPWVKAAVAKAAVLGMMCPSRSHLCAGSLPAPFGYSLERESAPQQKLRKGKSGIGVQRPQVAPIVNSNTILVDHLFAQQYEPIKTLYPRRRSFLHGEPTGSTSSTSSTPSSSVLLGVGGVVMVWTMLCEQEEEQQHGPSLITDMTCPPGLLLHPFTGVLSGAPLVSTTHAKPPQKDDKLSTTHAKPLPQGQDQDLPTYCNLVITAHNYGGNTSTRLRLNVFPPSPWAPSQHTLMSGTRDPYIPMTIAPTAAPTTTGIPTAAPTPPPTPLVTLAPSISPTFMPTIQPTPAPSASPTKGSRACKACLQEQLPCKTQDGSCSSFAGYGCPMTACNCLISIFCHP
jgi:hypothetical protein